MELARVTSLVSTGPRSEPRLPHPPPASAAQSGHLGAARDGEHWYIVLEDWHPFTHLGLDGIPWPLDEGPVDSLRLDVERGSLPLNLGPMPRCLFDVCHDLAAARAYFDVATAAIGRVYLIEVGTIGSSMSAVDGFDYGRPDGGFSVIGQEICKSVPDHLRFGHMLNDKGLFPSEKRMQDYMDDRAHRLATEGLEHLDESIPVKIHVLEVGSSSACRP